ncbi:FIG00657639: hypothetical protein [hydrothermal vent metagenome]|uniref:DUF445 domain-containing protein n=1 Tax=hydrothermal vent metagenome TaxID=652676 RepID=A0A3B0YYP4_9ZZZZ
MPKAFNNKSFITNILCILLIVIGLLSPIYGQTILHIGLFALSGAVTNWLAVHMLFEKVPFLYGSGVIPNQFEHFRLALKELIMEQFFTRENIERFISEEMSHGSSKIDLSPVIEVIDYDQLFDKLVETITESSLGGMLGMIGGPSALEALRAPFKEKMKETFKTITESDSFQSSIAGQFDASPFQEKLINNIEHIVINRLNELTPQMVKEIVQKMIKKHLGWLVVWGGVLGGLIGFVLSFWI